MSASEKKTVNKALQSENINPGRPPQKLVVPELAHPQFIKRAFDVAVAFADSRTVFFICLVILPIAVLSYYPNNLEDYDVWFHLAYGREYVQNLSWSLDPSQFSWTPAHKGASYVTWIGSGLFFLIHETAGVTGLYLLYWLVFIGMITCMTAYARSAGFRINITILTALLGIFIAIKIISVLIKPEIFTTLFFFAATAIYFHGKQPGKNNFYWIYPILFLVWVNTHGGVIVGLAFLGLVVGLETLARLLHPNQAMPFSRYNMLTFFTFLSILATLINPDGFVFHMDTLGNWFTDEFGIKEHYSHIVAYESLWPYISTDSKMIYFIASAWTLSMMGISFIVLLIVYILRKNEIPIAATGLNLFFFLFSMSMARAVIFYPPVWFCSIIYLLRQLEAFRLPRKAAPFALIVFAAFSIYSPWTLLSIEYQRAWLGSGMDEFLPIKEVRFIKENKLPGPIFNDYIIGGYMMWAMYPDYKVFIDSRFLPYDKSLLDDYFNMGPRYGPLQGGVEIFREKYGFNIALIHMRELPMIQWLVNSPQWSLVYFDNTAAVLMHRSVLHTLSPDVRAMDVGPQRFRDLKNPKTLENLFNFYQNFSIAMATDIRDTYERNVSHFYHKKKARIAFMDHILKTKQGRPARLPGKADASKQISSSSESAAD